MGLGGVSYNYGLTGIVLRVEKQTYLETLQVRLT